MKPKKALFEIVKHFPQRDLRLKFNAIRRDFLITGRVSFLTRISIAACVNLGYVIESYLKQGLIELGNTDNGLQLSHDLKKLFTACKAKGLYKNVEVSEDFLDYSTSIFQMRYPSTTIMEGLKAFQRNNIISISTDTILAYDDFIVQLDEALFDYTQDYYSSSIVLIACVIDEHPSRLFYHHNLYALKRFEKYAKIITDNYKRNKSAISALAQGPEHFWSYGDTMKLFYVPFNEAETIHPNPAKGFVFPGEILRDDNGIVTGWKSNSSIYSR